MTDRDLDETAWVDQRIGLLAPIGTSPTDVDQRLSAMHARRAELKARRLRRGGMAVAAAIVFAVVPGTRAFGARCIEACVSATTRVAQLMSDQEPAAQAPKVVGAGIGDLAPALAGRDAAGRPVSLASLRGRVVVVNFWATWCAPCRTEIPMLNALAARLGPRGLSVIGVSLDHNGWQAIQAFVEAHPVEYPMALADDDIAASFGGVGTLPATFVINRDGVIVARMVGALRDGQYDDLLEKLLR